MEVALILKFLKANWLPILLGIVVLSTLSYIKVIKVERDHYHKEYTALDTKYTDMVAESKEKQAVLTRGSEEITAKYKDTLKTANDLVTVNAGLNEENIKNAKELHDVKLSLNAVRLFNASKQSASDTSAPAPVTSDDGKASSSAESSSSLDDMLIVVNTNDANHTKCIKQVEEWQAFWADYEAKTNAVSH